MNKEKELELEKLHAKIIDDIETEARIGTICYDIVETIKKHAHYRELKQKQIEECISLLRENGYID